jgi:hypothetical protein
LLTVLRLAAISQPEAARSYGQVQVHSIARHSPARQSVTQRRFLAGADSTTAASSFAASSENGGLASALAGPNSAPGAP